MTPDLMHGFRVGCWTVEPMLGVVTGPDGKSRHLQPKVMDVLVYLAANAEEPVTRDVLLDEVWGKHAVTDEPLTRVIGELRRFLDDDPRNPQYIETIPKRGYRLIRPVEALQEATPAKAPDSAAANTTSRQARRSPVLLGALGLALVGALFLTDRVLHQGTSHAPPATDLPPANSVAVMPFTSCRSDEPSNAFAAGMAEEVRRMLAELDEITVSAKSLVIVSRASSLIFWKAGLEPEEITRRLNVRYVLQAEICNEDSLLKANVSLIDAGGYLVHTETLEQINDADDMVAETMCRTITNTLANWLGSPRTDAEPMLVNRHAREHLLMAREYIARGQRTKARDALHNALAIEPDNPDAIFELAIMELNGLDLDQRQGFEAAMQRAEHAKQIALRRFLANPEVFETNFTVGRILAALADWQRNLDWRYANAGDQERLRLRFAEAEDYLRAATSLNPASSEAARLLAHVIDAQGRKNEALTIRERALNTDPFNPDLNWAIALSWAERGRYDDAITLLRRFEDPAIASYRTWNWQLELMQIHGYWDDQCETFIRLFRTQPEIAAHGQIRFQLSWFIGDLLHLGLYDEAEAIRAYLDVSDLPMWAQLYADRFYLWGLDDQEELTRRTRERLSGMTDEEFLDPWVNLPMNWAWDLAAGGDVDAAIELMEKLQFAPTLRNERDARSPLLLARLYTRAGRNSDAEPILERLSRRLESDVAIGILHPESLYQLAEVYSLQGRSESAVHVMQLAIEHHWRMPWWRLPWNSNINGLDKDPRIQALRQTVEQDLERQADRIRSLLAEHNIDELMAPLT